MNFLLEIDNDQVGSVSVGSQETLAREIDKNPDLLINNTPDNFDRYQEIVRQYQEDNK